MRFFCLFAIFKQILSILMSKGYFLNCNTDILQSSSFNKTSTEPVPSLSPLKTIDETLAPPTTPNKEKSELHRYKIIKKCGKGSYGTVYKA